MGERCHREHAAQQQNAWSHELERHWELLLFEQSEQVRINSIGGWLLWGEKPGLESYIAQRVAHQGITQLNDVKRNIAIACFLRPYAQTVNAGFVFGKVRSDGIFPAIVGNRLT